MIDNESVSFDSLVGFVMAHSIVVGTDTGMGTYLLKKG
jgi:hypothetical protein